MAIPGWGVAMAGVGLRKGGGCAQRLEESCSDATVCRWDAGLQWLVSERDDCRRPASSVRDLSAEVCCAAIDVDRVLFIQQLQREVGRRTLVSKKSLNIQQTRGHVFAHCNTY